MTKHKYRSTDDTDRFYGGGGREKPILYSAYLRLIKHTNSIYKVDELWFINVYTLTPCTDSSCVRVDGRLRDQVSLVGGGLRINIYPCHVLFNTQRRYPGSSTTGERQRRCSSGPNGECASISQAMFTFH